MLQLITWAADNFIAGKLLEKTVIKKQAEFSAKLKEAEIKMFLAEKRKEASKQSEAKAINEKEEALKASFRRHGISTKQADETQNELRRFR